MGLNGNYLLIATCDACGHTQQWIVRDRCDALGVIHDTDWGRDLRPGAAPNAYLCPRCFRKAVARGQLQPVKGDDGCPPAGGDRRRANFMRMVRQEVGK